MRADEASRFWHQVRELDIIKRIISSGGYPELAQGMSAPEDGTNEGSLMEARMRSSGVSGDIFIDPGSTHTFANFSESINHGFLRPTLYSPDYRLGLSVNEAHSMRVSLIAKYAMNLSHDCLFRLEPMRPEADPEVWKKERMLAKLTQIAINLTDKNTFPPGSPGCTEHVTEIFIQIWDDRERHIARFDEHYGSDWRPTDILVL